jgi:1-deoxy-D-xylulose-5-phosphate reductoisomerase
MESPVKRLLVLGSTGSIGVSTLAVAGAFPDRFRVEALVAGRNLSLLREQIAAFKPAAVGVADPAAGKTLKKDFPRLKVYAGPRAVTDLARECRAEMAVAAIVGEAGLRPAYAALDSGKDLALANKEALVMAGAHFASKARERKRRILPIDSEHCALHQALRSGRRAEVLRLVLTASGGPFWRMSREAFARIRVEDALRHPTWRMGPKITIDSATLGNKALEVIEAHFLFGLPAEKISVVIHPQSIVHSMVEWRDGSLVAQLGVNDMRFPIQYALTWPRRLPAPYGRLALDGLNLEFHLPDGAKFPLLGLGYAALHKGGAHPAVFSLANEMAVLAFLDHRIRFSDISAVVEQALDRLDDPAPRDLDTLLDLCEKVRRRTGAHLNSLQRAGR